MRPKKKRKLLDWCLFPRKEGGQRCTRQWMLSQGITDNPGQAGVALILATHHALRIRKVNLHLPDPVTSQQRSVRCQDGEGSSCLSRRVGRTQGLITYRIKLYTLYTYTLLIHVYLHICRHIDMHAYIPPLSKAQWIKCLLHKCEDLGSNPRAQVR